MAVVLMVVREILRRGSSKFPEVEIPEELLALQCDWNIYLKVRNF